ncbi:MAG: ABC transporter ATP-binding protein [Phycisphaeraceae bacterium]|nr:ABC transporter ATP-binding protein [Phycisphaeraceae bacterium]MCW5753925.1 ABC transporter ATP-binding protein [Phycisphaeraceae bacterium]
MSTPQPILSGSNLHKTYRLGRAKVPVLRGASIAIAQGETVAILGASGSGKSTMLHLLGGLDRPDQGASSAVTFRGRNIAEFSESERNAYRARDIGFVFQFYHLLPELNVIENVLIAAMVRHRHVRYLAERRELRSAAEHILGALGLSSRLRHRPVELSGGERQRVAIARALINRPTVLLADEPTGNLDRATGGEVLDALTAIQRERALTLLIVTHDSAVASRADRVIRLRDGQVTESTTA